MTDKQALILKLKGISREMKEASKLIDKLYKRSDNANQLRGAAAMIDSWILEIKKEGKNDK